MKDWIKATYYNWYNAVVVTKQRIGEAAAGRSFSEILRDYVEGVKSELGSLKDRVHDLKGTNYSLGMMHYKSGNMTDALLRFKMLKKFYPEMIELDYLIGRAYIENSEDVKAKPFIESYLKSQDQKYRKEAEYCYDVLENRKSNISAIPLTITEHTFDVISPEYNEIYFSGESSPQDQLFQMINANCIDIGMPYGHIVLDVGCGTGYMGELLKKHKIASVIHGLDISTNMIESCKALKTDDLSTYDALYKSDVDSFMSSYQQSTKFTIVSFSNFFLYYKDVSKCLAFASSVLADKGAIALNYKTSSEDLDVEFDTYMEEFRYGDAYITKLAAEAGLKIKTRNEVEFIDGDKGFCMILVK